MSQTSRMWCLDTLSSIVGTVIGIILTFGVTFWIEYQDKKKDNLKISLMVLENILEINYFCGLSYQEIIETAPILEEMITLTPEKVATMPQDSIEYYYHSFPSSLFRIDNFARNLLNSNFDIVRNTDNYDFLFQVNQFYYIYDGLKDFYEKRGPSKLLLDMNEVLMEKGIQSGTMDNTPRWNLMETVKSDRIKYYIRIYLDLFVPKLEEYIQGLKDKSTEIYQLADYQGIYNLYNNSSTQRQSEP